MGWRCWRRELVAAMRAPAVSGVQLLELGEDIERDFSAEPLGAGRREHGHAAPELGDGRRGEHAATVANGRSGRQRREGVTGASMTGLR